LIGGQADRVLEALGLQVLVDVRQREGRIGAEGTPAHPAAIAGDDRIEHVAPAPRAVHVACAECAPFEIAVLVEDEERMVAGAREVPVVGRAFEAIWEIRVQGKCGTPLKKLEADPRSSRGSADDHRIQRTRPRRSRTRDASGRPMPRRDASGWWLAMVGKRDAAKSGIRDANGATGLHLVAVTMAASHGTARDPIVVRPCRWYGHTMATKR
jgi:hypothetical protein